MTGGEKKLLRLIENYTYNVKRLEETEERLKSKTYKITPSYAQSGGGGGNGSKSRVEDFVEKTAKLKREVERYRRQIRAVDMAMETPDLTKTERQALEWIAVGGRLSSYAESKGIYQSTIYKIRDKALKKAVSHLETHFEGKFG